MRSFIYFFFILRECCCSFVGFEYWVVVGEFKSVFLWLQNFLGETKKYFNAELESVNFKTGAEEARVKINSWVERQTHGTSRINILISALHGGLAKSLMSQQSHSHMSLSVILLQGLFVSPTSSQNHRTLRPATRLWCSLLEKTGHMTSQSVLI